MYCLEDLRSATCEQVRAETPANTGSIFRSAFRLGANQLGAVGRCHHRLHLEAAFGDCRIGADRDLTSAAQCRQHGALRGHSRARCGMIEHAARIETWAFRACLDRERPLTHGRAHAVRAEYFSDAIGPAQPLETRGGEHDRVVLAFVELTDSRIEIATDGFHD